MSVRVMAGDMLAQLPNLAAEGIRAHACVTDPPYHFNSIVKRFGAPGAAEAKEGASGVYRRSSKGFMGKQWDGGDIAFQPETWAAIGACLLPGAHLVAFAGTKGWHRMTCAIEDAGFEIRDTLLWIYGSGFPKSHNIGKAIDRAAGATREVVGESEFAARRVGGRDDTYKGRTEYRLGSDASLDVPATDAARQWDGWGTALKPAFEPIVLARWPLASRSVAANVLDHGCGALNIDACRVDAEVRDMPSSGEYVGLGDTRGFAIRARPTRPTDLGRWPANVLHDGSAEVVSLFPDAGGSSESIRRNGIKSVSLGKLGAHVSHGHADSGSAARFFKSCATTVEDIAWMPEPASYAVSCSSLSGRAAVSVLSHVVARLTAGSTLLAASYRAPSTSATAPEFATLCASVIAAIQIIGQGFSQGLPPQSVTVCVGRAKCAATPNPTGTMTITASHWKSDGSAEPVIFDITQPNAARGAPASASSRVFYSSKADPADRMFSRHPTVKPVDLMRWLVRLVTPRGGLVLDPFAGSGTTGQAALAEGARAILIEREAEYLADIARRIAHVTAADTPLFGGAAL